MRNHVEEKANTDMGSDDTLGKVKDPLVAFIQWVKKRSPREKLIMGIACALVALLILWTTIRVRGAG